MIDWETNEVLRPQLIRFLDLFPQRVEPLQELVLLGI
jgi:hypothetical protein